AGTVSGSGTLTVTGNHTWAHSGTYDVTTTVSTSTTTLTLTKQLVITGAALSPTGQTLSGSAWSALSGVQVATFTDQNTSSQASDFVALIDWGDGFTSAGTVTGSGGSFSVAGSHTYRNAGS